MLLTQEACLVYALDSVSFQQLRSYTGYAAVAEALIVRGFIAIKKSETQL